MNLALCLLIAATLVTQTPISQKDPAMTRAAGEFDVKITPQPNDEFGAMSVDKQYRGDLVGTARARMLTAGDASKGSAAYVAIENVSGTLHGKKGTFALHHVGVMDRNAQNLTIAVVPGSATGDLAGLSGTMTIDIKDGKHFYTFNYAIAK
ncbi:MAG: DUF3224 domain-containing protein [Vicinamibacterales bacterium]